MLSAREFRRLRQETLLAKYDCPLISLTLNIAGPEKYTPLTLFAFHAATEQLQRKLGTPMYFSKQRNVSGCEAFFVYDADAQLLKQRCIELEERTPAGRLLDIDVLLPSGEKLSRPIERRCLVCGGPVAPCARSRAHSLELIQAKTQLLLQDFAAERIACSAVDALLSEARLTPKPGLVDAHNNGAHQDMTLSLLEASAESLLPFFRQAALLGMENVINVPALQAAGRDAEQAMFAVTGGVNTHKGAVFSLGILTAAAGAFLMNRGNFFPLAASLANQLSSAPSATHGAQVAARYRAGGARQEAEQGFPQVQLALSLLQQGYPPLRVLLHLMAEVEDTNLLWRGGAEGLAFVQQTAAALLPLSEEEWLFRLTGFDDECIRRNLSPGGCADLLASALFVHGFLTPFYQSATAE